ncbi:peroxidase family protein, partial [Pelomonas sp. KK5]|uniref:peroxidase family protein n=1 Tax=Pelomonas sp. KK5 TaxID=1855730 RepID=UPI0018E97AF4
MNSRLAGRRAPAAAFFTMLLFLSACAGPGVLDPAVQADDTAACARMVAEGFRRLPGDRAERFNGKVSEAVAQCRGGARPLAFRKAPYVDWANYWAAGDASSLAPGTRGAGGHLGPNGRGIDGALLDLEYQRMELIKFNLFDNSGTYPEYVLGSRQGVPGPAVKQWDAMRLPAGAPAYAAVGGDGPQLCTGELIRFRNIDGICNDLKNPRMGSTGMPFARNVEFASTFPDLGKTELARNRHGDRLALLKPDPQLISRKLFTRPQSQPDACREGQGLPGDAVQAQCDYKKAPFFNVLAAFWIQFMTHDWFSHLEEGHNAPGLMAVGCADPSSGCRPEDRIDPSLYAETTEPPVFEADGRKQLARAYKTTANRTTGWWDASQLYGYDETSRRRVRHDPKDPARLLLLPGHLAGRGEAQGYLPAFAPGDPIEPQWAGQEAAAFPDNWSVGMSFFHNVFAREHNAFVDAFRRRAAATPQADSGLRNPSRPDQVIRYVDVTDRELFEVARLVIAAEIAKIHTTEWTTQLLYDEPLYLAMNANWSGLFARHPIVSAALEQIVVNNFGKSENAKKATQWYSALASGPGIFGLGARVYADDAVFALWDPAKTDLWSMSRLDDVNGGVNHFGSPFNFPEEFVSVYRLHPLVPDLIEFREWDHDPNTVSAKVPVINTFRAKATPQMHDRGLANWALSMGRQRLGLLTLQNMPQFMQNLELARAPAGIGKIDIAALDIIRDRERGVPRFNEFRRQYGLRQLTGFDDFVDPHAKGAERAEQLRLTGLLREVYGQHRCDAGKIISTAQKMEDGSAITDCLGHPDGSVVDNIEDLDTMVGWLSEFDHPHGFAISETQFQVFILNASRRLFSDRFFTSSFRPEFYTTLGVDWVNDNGPDGRRMEPGEVNGHLVEVLPLKRVLQRVMPELGPELAQVVNVFDPW